MKFKEFFSFKKNKFFWLNIIAMIVVAIALVLIVLKSLDIYTHHGEAIAVPDAKGMSISQARALFENAELELVISDSTYVKDQPAGIVLDHSPQSGQRVKKGRVISLTINTLNTPLQLIPDVADNSSLRQAQARILASGFKLDKSEFISGERDWVYGVKYNKKMLKPGDKVPVGASLTLVVGDGTREDTEIGIPELPKTATPPPAKPKEPEVDAVFFN
jgi:Uncharacterized protein conserved in bacteria